MITTRSGKSSLVSWSATLRFFLHPEDRWGQVKVQLSTSAFHDENFVTTTRIGPVDVALTLGLRMEYDPPRLQVVGKFKPPGGRWSRLRVTVTSSEITLRDETFDPTVTDVFADSFGLTAAEAAELLKESAESMRSLSPSPGYLAALNTSTAATATPAPLSTIQLNTTSAPFSATWENPFSGSAAGPSSIMLRQKFEQAAGTAASPNVFLKISTT